MNAQRVQIFSLKLPPTGTPKDKRRYVVRWRVDGRDRMRSFKTKAMAERLRTDLQVAVNDGVRFNRESCEPESWMVSDMTWWSWSREWVELKWPRWSGNSRRSAVESLVAFTPHLVRNGHRGSGRESARPPGDLVSWLRNVGYLPATVIDPADPMLVWLERWSVPLADIDAGLLEQVLTLGTTKRDGASMAVPVVRRRRTALNAVLRAAVRRGLLDSNPMDRTEWVAPDRTLEVDVAVVPSPAEIMRAVDHVAKLPTSGAKYAALFACVGLGGLRPSEAIGLQLSDLTLPDEGWGMARLRGATTSPGGRYTVDGAVHERKGLKHRPTGEVREVPLPPALVLRLRLHLERFPALDERVFSTDTGRAMSTSNYTKVWSKTRAELWPSGHHLDSLTVYYLRHGAATMMLRAGVMPAEVARRLGHSVDVLTRVYAGVVHGEREQSNALIDEVLA